VRRWVVVGAGVVVVVVLGVVQIASSAAYGDLAVPYSLPAALHGVDSTVFRAALGGPRARAAAALHGGDADDAQRILAGLPDDPETLDLRGRVAFARGDRDTALADYVRAGDVVRAEALIEASVAFDPARALAQQERLVAALRDDPNASEVSGEAWWRLGQLRAAVGYRDAARRPALWHAAEDAYERALQLAPNEETYLLAAGYQSLANGDVASAQRFYARAVDVVPDSADAFGGLAWTDAARGDCADARTNLARSRALRGAAAHTVRDPVDDPQVGAPLRRCAG